MPFFVALVQQHLQRLHPRVQQRQKAPVLRPRIVVESGAAPVGSPALGVGFLNEGIHPGPSHFVDPVAQVFCRGGIGQVAPGNAGRIADVDNAALTAGGKFSQFARSFPRHG